MAAPGRIACLFAVVFFVGSVRQIHGQEYELLANVTCPDGCDCLPDQYVPDGVKVECLMMSQVPDFWPEETTSINLELTGYPGIPSGSFMAMDGLCSLYIEGEVGNVDAGAFVDVRGNGCNHTALPLSQNRLLFLGTDVHVIAAGAFSNIRDFELITFRSYQGRGDIDTISKNAFQTVEDIQQFTFEYIQVGYLDDEAFVGFRSVELFLWEASTVRAYNVGTLGPFSDFRNVETLKFEQMKSVSGQEWDHGFSSFFFTGIGDGVNNIVFQNFDLTVIEPNAFSGVRNVKSILFDGVDVENITENAFANMDGIEELKFKGYNTFFENGIVFQSRAFAGMNNVKLITFQYMKVDLAPRTFVDLTNLGAVRFTECEIAEGDISAFSGLHANQLSFDCIVLPNEEQSHWRFGEADYIGHLSYDYGLTCDVVGEAWIEFGAFIRTNISRVTFRNTTIRHINRLAFAEMRDFDELSFTDCTIDRSEPNSFYNFERVGSIVFRNVNWGIFAPRTFTYFEDVDLMEFDNVSLGARGIFPSDSFVDVDNVRHVRFNKLDVLTFSTRAFGWEGASTNIQKFEITNSDIDTIQSMAFSGLANTTFHFEGNKVPCMETGAFMNMKHINTIFSGNELACEPILEVPWHLDWTDRLHCVADQDPNCLVVTDPTTPTTPPAPTTTTTPGAAGTLAASVTLLALTIGLIRGLLY